MNDSKIKNYLCYNTCVDTKQRTLRIVLTLISVTLIVFYLKKYLLMTQSQYSCQSQGMRAVQSCNWADVACQTPIRCLRVYSDGGKVCNSGAECTSGFCMVSEHGSEIITPLLRVSAKSAGPEEDSYSISLPTAELGTCRKEETAMDGCTIPSGLWINSTGTVIAAHQCVY